MSGICLKQQYIKNPLVPFCVDFCIEKFTTKSIDQYQFTCVLFCEIYSIVFYTF